VVARHDQQGRGRPTAARTCLDCGTRYSFTATYKGNYCPDCHETWIARQRGEESPPRTPSRLPPTRPSSTDDETPDDQYDDE
jgi:predicted RNA-binding Zn-ribbon protein involved in translation (DUF1610 family)